MSELTRTDEIRTRFRAQDLTEVTFRLSSGPHRVSVVRDRYCSLNHGGNRYLSARPGDRYAQCMGCGNFVGPA